MLDLLLSLFSQLHVSLNKKEKRESPLHAISHPHFYAPTHFARLQIAKENITIQSINIFLNCFDSKGFPQ